MIINSKIYIFVFIIELKKYNLIDFAIENKINSIEEHYVNNSGQLSGESKTMKISEDLE